MTQKLTIVYRKAFQNKPELDNLLVKVAIQTHAKPISNLKNPETAIKKVGEKQKEDPARHYTLEKVNDIARARLVYGTLNELKQGVAAFRRDIKSTNMKIAKVDDFFSHPEDGYRGYHIDVSFPNGQHSEVQFHTVNSYAASMATHAVHERYDKSMPDDVKKKNEAINNQIMKWTPQQAASVAMLLEQRNAPMQAKAQISALQTAASNHSIGRQVNQQGGQI